MNSRRRSRRNSPEGHAAPHGRRSLLVEALEARQLLSAVSVARGALMIEGTSGSDTITVSVDPLTRGMLRISVNGRQNQIDSTGLKRINITALEGDDLVLIDQSNGAISLPVNVAGGSGNDTITGGSGPDLLQGGRGNDILRGGLAGDILEGDAGNDTLYGGDGKDNVGGDGGTDTIYTGGSRRDVIVSDASDTIDRSEPVFQLPPILKKNAKPNFFNPTPTGLTPDQVRHVYGLDGVSETGAGQTIVIVDAFDDPTVRRDLRTFSETFNLPTITNDNFQVYYATKQRPNFDAGWSGEISLDVQWAHAIAPDAKIVLVETKTNSNADLRQGFERAAELLQPTGGVISMSLGRTELYIDTLDEQIFNNPDTRNITWVAATGDTGAMAGWPAVIPEVTAVGGTFLDLDPVTGDLIAEQGWTGSSGGISSLFPAPSFQSDITLDGARIGNRRAVPDVAFLADPRSGVAIFDSSPDVTGFSGWQAIGGTSLASPMFAAFTALVNQKRSELGKGVIGSAMNTALYQAAANDYAGNFNDITSGTNGYPALKGYDLVTGLGTPKPALIDTLAATNIPTTGQNVNFEGATLRLDPGLSSTGAAPLIKFGGTGFASKTGNQWDLDLVPNARSGVSIGLDGPLTPDAEGFFSTTGTVDIATGPDTSATYMLKVRAYENDNGNLVGEFYAISRRGKILYQGDKPLFYGTFESN